ncbi:MAG TPA: iron-containing redox enzyme family protein [Thermoanaerobaculia bacterium]|nr:iron-containing redox enzyme family protein [Thermoanaerobaculia bacterium]
MSRLNDARLRPRLDAALTLEAEMELRALELSFLEAERAAVATRAASAPDEPRAFLEWYEALRENGPGQHDPLFAWLANEATMEQLAWFLAQEVAGEAGFDDLVALTQLKMPTRAKLELARNYWDEMGRGKEGGMHGPMLDRLAAELNVRERGFDIVWEAVALGNLLAGLAANRRYAYHAIGALGVIELTAPGRAEQVNLAMQRLGVPARTRQYYALHATLDVRHSFAWNAEVIVPLVAAEPRAARAMAEGALMRLRAGERCFERYRQELKT